jgi:hypothetical protein
LYAAVAVGVAPEQMALVAAMPGTSWARAAPI